MREKIAEYDTTVYKNGLAQVAPATVLPMLSPFRKPNDSKKVNLLVCYGLCFVDLNPFLDESGNVSSNAIPSFRLIQETLLYATELERII